jgi:hypothetical protein
MGVCGGQVFKGYKEFQSVYGDNTMLPTRLFLEPIKLGQEVEVDIAPGMHAAPGGTTGACASCACVCVSGLAVRRFVQGGILFTPALGEVGTRGERLERERFFRPVYVRERRGAYCGTHAHRASSKDVWLCVAAAGKTLFITMKAIGPVDHNGEVRLCFHLSVHACCAGDVLMS